MAHDYKKFAHKPRILVVYGSLRKRSYSSLLAEKAARIIEDFGAEVEFLILNNYPSMALSPPRFNHD